MAKIQALLCIIFITSISHSQSANALNFDGADDFVNLNSLQTEMYTASDQFTIEFWMQGFKENQTSSIRTTMFAINEPTGENRLLLIMGGPSAQDGKLMIYPDGSWGTGAIYTSSVIIGDGECHHIAYSYDNGNCAVYIDGNLVNTHYAVCPITANDRYSLGQEYDNLTESQFYNGTIDDLRIWSTVRSAGEIATNMNEELSGSEPGLIAYYDFNQGTPDGMNSGLDYLDDKTTGNNNGTLENFLLETSVSNWTRGLCVSVFVNTDSKMNESIKVNIYPNPSSNYLTIEFNQYLPSDIDISVYSVTGALIQVNHFEDAIAFGRSLSISTADLLSGSYILHINSEVFSGVTRFMVSK